MLQGESHVSRDPILLSGNSICHRSRFAERYVRIKVKKNKQYNSSYCELGPPVRKLACLTGGTRLNALLSQDCHLPVLWWLCYCWYSVWAPCACNAGGDAGCFVNFLILSRLSSSLSIQSDGMLIWTRTRLLAATSLRSLSKVKDLEGAPVQS